MSHSSPDCIPIDVYDESEFVHYPAGPHDLLAVMHRLPPGVLDGLHSITLCLPREAQDEFPDDPHGPEIRFYHDPDPFDAGTELGWSLNSGPMRGDYVPITTKIFLFGYAYHLDIHDRPMWELYLRLTMLATLVQGVAHHWELSARMARGDWRGDDYQKNELYARRMAFTWVQEHVIPYLEETYPSDVRALRDWFIQQTGIALPLELTVCRDPSKQPRLHSAPGAFFYLMENVFREDSVEKLDETEQRLWFARRLRWAGHDSESRRVVEAVLTGTAEDSETLTMLAEMLTQDGDYDQAEATARRAIDIRPNWTEAWIALADLHCRQEQWDALRVVAGKGMEVAAADWSVKRFRLQDILAAPVVEPGVAAADSSDRRFQFQDDFNRLGALKLLAILKDNFSHLCELGLLAILKSRRYALIEDEFCRTVQQVSPTDDTDAALINRTAMAIGCLVLDRREDARNYRNPFFQSGGTLEPWQSINVVVQYVCSRQRELTAKLNGSQPAAFERLERDSKQNLLVSHIWTLLEAALPERFRNHVE